MFFSGAAGDKKKNEDWIYIHQLQWDEEDEDDEDVSSAEDASWVS